MNYKLLIAIASFSITANSFDLENNSWNRKILNCSQDKCTVQDFMQTGEKLTDPFTIHKERMKTKSYPEYFDSVGSTISPIIGKVIVWYPSGEKLSEQNFDEKGNYEGKQIFWYKNGQKSKEEIYSQGILNGTSMSWYKNGQQATLVYAKQGKYIKGINWYENGVKKLEYSFQPNRINKSWYKNGQKKKYLYYQNNTHVKTEYWDERGHKRVESNINEANPL